MAKCHTRTTTQHYHATRAVNSVDPGREDEEVVSPSGLAAAAGNPSIKVVVETSPLNTRETSSSNDTDFITASKSLNSLDVRGSFSSSSIGETESQSDMPYMSEKQMHDIIKISIISSSIFGVAKSHVLLLSPRIYIASQNLICPQDCVSMQKRFCTAESVLLICKVVSETMSLKTGIMIYENGASWKQKLS